MSINSDDQFAQYTTGPSAGLVPYPVTLYDAPVHNVGRDRTTMQHIDLVALHALVRDGKLDDCNLTRVETVPEIVAELRELAPHKRKKGPDGKRAPESIAYDNIKKRRLPFAIMSGHYEAGHRHSPDPQKPSGNLQKPLHSDEFPQCQRYGAHPPLALSRVRFLETDNLDAATLATERARIQAHSSVITCWLSAGGAGLHVCVLVDPVPTNDAESHAAHAAATLALSIEDTVDGSAKNLARLAFLSHDPYAYLNLDAIPLIWEMPDNDPQNGVSAQSSQTKDARDRRRGPGSGSDKETSTRRRKTPPGGPGAKTGTPVDRCGHDASDDLVNSALDTLSAGKAGVEDSHLLAVLGNMKAMGRSFQEFDEWAAAAGCMCDRRPRWDNPPTGHQSDKPGWSIVNLGACPRNNVLNDNRLDQSYYYDIPHI